MEISNGHRNQAMASYPLNEVLPVLGCHKASLSLPYHLHEEMNPSLQSQCQSQSQQALRCPRCDSINTKFCYYNNYSLSQPRYFCKSCRRYWTRGGSLRNIPIGGGCRKTKKSSSSFSSSSPSPPSSSSKKLTRGSNPNPNPGRCFLGILRSGGFVVSTNTITSAVDGIQSHCYGSRGDNGVMIPFDHGGQISVSNSATAATDASASIISNGSYWNGAGSIPWNGFINGFSHEIHHGDI